MFRHCGAVFRGEELPEDEDDRLYDIYIFGSAVFDSDTNRTFAGGALLHLIHTPADIFADSKLYLDVYTGGLVFLFFYNIATGIFSALGDSKTPFIFLAFHRYRTYL